MSSSVAIVGGYAAVWNSTALRRVGTRLMKDAPAGIDHFTERIGPSCFAYDEVRALFAHRQDEVLGGTHRGLIIFEDRRGLGFALALRVGNPVADRALREIRAGLVRHCSWGCRIAEATWSRENGRWIRTITDAVLEEISLVRTPAYWATEVRIERDPAIDRLANLRRRLELITLEA